MRFMGIYSSNACGSVMSHTLCNEGLFAPFFFPVPADVSFQVKQQVCVIKALSPPQVPELFGPIRTIAEGRGETVLIGTTKNFVLQGGLDGQFMCITQVNTTIHYRLGGYSFT